MNKKGFTFVELLCIMMLLCAIALISLPAILKAIEKAEKSAFESSANGVIKSVKMHSLNNYITNVTYTFPTNDIEIEGGQPNGGEARVNHDGKVAIAIYNEDWCAIRGYSDDPVTIIDYDETTCVLPVDIHGFYSEGDLLKIRVGLTTTHNFYVLKDNGDTITAIMDRNIGDNTAWGEEGVTTPIIANSFLEQETLGWSNVDEVRLPSALELIERTEWYKSLTAEEKENWEDVYDIEAASVWSIISSSKCKINAECRDVIIDNGYESLLLPTWLDINLYGSGDDTLDSNGNDRYAYWTNEYFTFTLMNDELESAWVVTSEGYILMNNILNNTDVGVRPVITIPKNHIIEKLSEPEYVTTENYENYNVGDLLEIEVSKGVMNKFYVLEDNRNTVTVIMDRNIGESVKWGNNGDSETTIANNYLKNLTSDWEYAIDINLPSAVDILGQTEWYQELSDDEKENWEEEYVNYYNEIGDTNASLLLCDSNISCRTGLINAGFGDIVLPPWLDINLRDTGDSSVDSNNIERNGYWTRNPVSANPASAWAVYNGGTVFMAVHNGIRPKISINKSHIVRKITDRVYVDPGFSR